MRKARPTDRPEGCRAHFDELLLIARPMLLDCPMFVKSEAQLMTPEDNDPMTAAAIARLAGVGRAAVSNWRRRYPDFPKPVAGSSASPMFSRAEVQEWLTATGKADQLATAGRTTNGTQRLTSLPTLSDELHETSSWREVFGAEERSIADLSSGELLAKVMASLLPRTIAAARSADADDAELPVVIDPACFEATLLMAVADRFGNRLRLAG